MVLQGAQAAEWSPGDEADVLGHTFSEEMWTNDNITKEVGDKNVTFAVSFVNYSGAQAFLVALKDVRTGEYVSTLPYQLFGMHYVTPSGQEVFIGAVMAFLMAYNDTYNGTGPGSNGMPDPGNEDVYYVIPFGVGEAFEDASYAPIVEAIPVEKLDEGHYRFGIRYRNMYAKVIDANNPLSFLLSLRFPLYIAKFSELTVIYDVTIDPQSGLMRAETFYTLGQVSDLWIWGVRGNRTSIPSNFGISVVHYVALFTSSYQVAGADTGLQVETGIQQPLEEDLAIKIGERAEKALEIGFRGTFDLIDEETGLAVQQDAPAYNVLMPARAGDLILIQWQAAFSLHLMSLFAYGLSSDIRGRYADPTDLVQNGSEDFTKAAFWYAVSFPDWQGYRVEHDPTYTAFFGVAGGDGKSNLGGLVVLGIAALAVVATVLFIKRRRRSPP
ncbi:MAG: hypothetical protein ACE5HJ_03655 [Thermoplasmata archaeon]